MMLTELNKLHRLRIAPLLLVMVVAVVLMSTFVMFKSNTTLDTIQVMMLVSMMQTFLAPVFVSIVATRIVEIEHTGNGWQISGSVGTSKGKPCIIKALVAGVIIAAATVVELAIIVLMALIRNVPGLELHVWISYGLCLIVVNLIIAMFHIALAAVVDNQLINIGVGILGGFIGVFSLLLPAVFAYWQPWGYYAVITPVADTANGIAYVQPNYWAVVLFACLGLAVFATSVKFLDYSER